MGQWRPGTGWPTTTLRALDDTAPFARGRTGSRTREDGVRVWVDGVRIIDAWRDQAPATYTATRTLTAGAHEIRMEYYENAGGAVAQLSWAPG